MKKTVINTTLILAICFTFKGAQAQKDNQVKRPLLCGTPRGMGSQFSYRLSEAAIALTHQKVTYDPSYFSIEYPGGDVPVDKGVCTDVVIRAYRKLDIDLQKEIHEDMQVHFKLYPKNWGLQKPDPNIDHRRVPNLMEFFKRHGREKLITSDPGDYVPGDIVCWQLDNGLLHIGLVVNKTSTDGKRHLIVHNIGGGQVLEDVLFQYKIIGHYHYEI